MKRILIGGDTSTANSGFAVYKRNILSGLMNAGFQVAEVGNGGTIADQARVPWKYYPTGVAGDDPRIKEYRSNPANEYGGWRWENIAIHYKPTQIFEVSDPWQFSHMLMSPLRPYYSIIAAPTVDSIPQRQDFLQMFSQVDHLYAYTEWAKDYLNDNNLNCLGTFGMGIDPNIMKPLDKKELRQKYKVPADAIIFGFVARNQLRKRFPELIKAFNLYLKKAPPEIAKRSYLYLHTSSPDAGWNFATHLLEGDVINKVLFTYMCRKTGEIFCTTYKDDRTYSPFSGEMTAFMPNVVYSPSETKLNEVYNLFDYYVQCASNEGFGAPILEAAASNIPLIGTDYSAIKELVEVFGGQVVPTILNFDSNVMADRACVSPEVWSDAMLKYAVEKPAVNSRLVVLEKYTWSHIVNKIITAIDQADPPKERWDAPLKQYGFPPIKGDMTATQFIHLLSSHIPTLKWSPYNLLSMRSLNTQLDLRGKQLMTVTPEIIAQRYQEVINRINQVERLRCGIDPLPDEDYLK